MPLGFLRNNGTKNVIDLSSNIGNGVYNFMAHGNLLVSPAAAVTAFPPNLGDNQKVWINLNCRTMISGLITVVDLVAHDSDGGCWCLPVQRLFK